MALAGWFPLHRITTEFVWFSASYHILFLQDYFPTNIVVTFWSLGVEEKFYLLAPLLLLTVLRLKYRGLQYAAVILLVISVPAARYLTHVGHPDIETYDEFFYVFRSPFHLCLDALLLGTLCALIYRDRALYRWTQRPRSIHGLFWLGFACVAWLIAATPMLDNIDLFDKTVQQTLLAGGMAAMLLALALGGGHRKLFRGQDLFFLAKISYSWYLVHFPLFPGTAALLNTLAGFADLATTTQFALFLPVYLTVTVLAALLLHYVMEKPFVLLKDRIGARGRSVTSSEAQPAV